MVSGKPPRHSKSTAGPVTIDLDAKDVRPVETNGTNPPMEDKVEPVAAETPEAVFVNEKPPAPADLPFGRTVADDETEDGESASSERFTSDAKTGEADAGPVRAEPLSTDSKRESSSAGFLAAGILGGLIALLGAGSMQYAGYLPPFSATKQDAPLAAEIASLKQQIGSLSQQPSAVFDASSLEARLSALETAAPASASGSAASVEDSPAVKSLQDTITSLQSSIATLQTEKSAQDTTSADLSRRLDEAENKLNEPRDDIEVARAIASAGLKAAIDRGGPFLTELDTLSGVTPDDPAVASLRPFAATGVPSRAELMRIFPQAANAMLAALNQPDPNQGVFDRLTASAFSLVKVRPVGNIEGESADAVVARMEDKLRNGDLEGSVLEWNTLPEPAKSASTAFKQSLDARIEVEKLVNDTLSRAVVSTGQKG
jgi:hypothetical protein